MQNFTNDETRKKRNAVYSRDDILQQQIRMLLIQFNECCDSIFKLKQVITTEFSKSELQHHTRSLDILVKKRKLLSKKLSDLGYATEKRGRPRKDDNEKYKNNHVRMNCYLTNGNASILKSLKEDGYIDNISAFLNELLEAYFVSRKGGVSDEK